MHKFSIFSHHRHPKFPQCLIDLISLLSIPICLRCTILSDLFLGTSFHIIEDIMLEERTLISFHQQGCIPCLNLERRRKISLSIRLDCRQNSWLYFFYFVGYFLIYIFLADETNNLDCDHHHLNFNYIGFQQVIIFLLAT